ncbi:DNA cytosine methyltransferase [Methylobacterium gossipiicola]|uniref:Cytosine-specific methyltransferase n=1 Tax=Methylobacterium gossipiicola TaxID=582675 RepID=A0A1I2WM78_9HYPH|nr:DNA cytosine methyltransferase [Methylobacterium gossipiicola]SFH02490.1 DNA (cytosine-5)-methyltransferase 1 [Methylobacterium gossipiicola]
MGGEGYGTIGTIVDLFSGCGGFSLGAELAGFKSLAAIDVDPILQSGYRRNFPRSQAVQASVADIDGTDWRNLIGRQRPDGVIGGPPCQGFSLIGKRAIDDPRNTLIGHFFRHVNLLRPKFFVMENVEGLLIGDSKKLLLEAIETVKPRFTVLDPIVVRAADFGAATSRKRVIVVGYDPDEIESLESGGFSCGRLAPVNTVRDAISDLPGPIPAGGATDFGWARYSAHTPRGLSDYARELRRCPPPGLGSQEAVQRHANGYVSGLAETRHSLQVAHRYANTPGGKAEPITKSYRLEWHGLCPTLRAGTGSDKGSFQAVRPLHPGEGRVITVREAARLQGFPDWFTFHPTKWHSFRMLGNSVSPFVGRGLLMTLANKFPLPLAA